MHQQQACIGKPFKNLEYGHKEQTESYIRSTNVALFVSSDSDTEPEMHQKSSALVKEKKNWNVVQWAKVIFLLQFPYVSVIKFQ